MRCAMNPLLSGLLLQPQWPAPPGVGACMSLREGGVSQGPFGSFNLSLGVGDEPEAVRSNRQRFAQAIGARPLWMRQVHGTAVLRLRANTAEDAGAAGEPRATADAAWTTERGLACTVGAADCMPVLLALRDGSAVAAAHAGWRGLAGGVLQATVQALCAGTGARPSDCLAWMGPCLGPLRFEVQADVLAAFGAHPPHADALLFAPAPARDGLARWHVNLPALARRVLNAAGVQQVHDAQQCTFSDASRFFSYRRDGITGRHAAAIWRV
jgi:polyphenol oxidase